MHFIGEITYRCIHVFDTKHRFISKKHDAFNGKFSVLICNKGRFGIQVDKKAQIIEENQMILVSQSDFFMSWGLEVEAKVYEVHFESNFPFLKELVLVPFDLSKYSEWSFWKDKRYVMKSLSHELLSMNLMLLSKVHSQKKRYAIKASTKNSPRETLKDQVIDFLKKMVQANPSRNHSLKEIADQFGIHHAYFTHKLKKATGYTLMDLYYRVKIDIAKSYMKEGMTIREASEAMGFSDAFHFSNKYLKVTGYRPSKDPGLNTNHNSL